MNNPNNNSYPPEYEKGNTYQDVVPSYPIVSKSEIEKALKMVGKVCWGPSHLVPGMMVKVLVKGVNQTAREPWVLLKEVDDASKSDFYVHRKLPLRDFLDNCIEDDTQKALDGRVVERLVSDPENKIVVVNTTWDETEEDKQYRIYCMKKGRNIKPIEIQPDRYLRPVAVHMLPMPGEEDIPDWQD